MSKINLKKHSTGFTQIPNDLICDPSLSAKAKAIYCYIFSRPDTWQFYMQDMVKQMKEGKDAVREALKELALAGWIIRTQVKDKSGKFVWSEIEIFASPIKAVTVQPCGYFPHTAKPHTENPTHNNTDQSNTDLKEKKYIKKRKVPKVSLEFYESEHGVLAIENLHNWIEEHNLDKDKVKKQLEWFRSACPAGGYVYADYYAAFKNWMNRNGLQELQAAKKPTARHLVPASVDMKGFSI